MWEWIKKWFRTKSDINENTGLNTSVKFKVPLEIDYVVDLQQKADFIYDNSREYLLGTLEASKTLDKKSVLTLSFVFTVISFAMFKIIAVYFSKGMLSLSPIDLSILIFLLLLIISYTCIAILIVLIIFAPKEQDMAGNEPENLLQQENIDQYFPLMKIAEAVTYQSRIDKNHLSNARSSRVLKYCLIALVMLPLIEAILAGAIGYCF